MREGKLRAARAPLDAGVGRGEERGAAPHERPVQSGARGIPDLSVSQLIGENLLLR